MWIDYRTNSTPNPSPYTNNVTSNNTFMSTDLCESISMLQASCYQMKYDNDSVQCDREQFDSIQNLQSSEIKTSFGHSSGTLVVAKKNKLHSNH